MLRGFCIFLESRVAASGSGNWEPSAENSVFIPEILAIMIIFWQCENTTSQNHSDISRKTPNILVDWEKCDVYPWEFCLGTEFPSGMQVFYVLTKVIGCTWERKNFIHSVKYIQLSENLLSLSLGCISQIFKGILKKKLFRYIFYSWTNHTIALHGLLPWPQGKKGTISALVNMYWASPILRAVSLIFFFCQAEWYGMRNSCSSGKRRSHLVGKNLKLFLWFWCRCW